MSEKIDIKDPINKAILEAIFDYTPTQEIHYKAKTTKKSVFKRLKKLKSEGHIELHQSGLYQLTPKEIFHMNFDLKGLSESEVFDNEIEKLGLDLNANAKFIMFYGFTEILNNAVDHSKGKSVEVAVVETSIGYEVYIIDNGIGIFRKLKKVFGYKNESESILHLSKGKLTTDKKNHSGQGIFFTSRMMDHFHIFSGDNYFSHDYNSSKDVLSLANPTPNDKRKGTAVIMSLRKQSQIDGSKVFNDYTSTDGDYAFKKTMVPILLTKYASNDLLVSRSQAKMVIANLQEFEEIIMNFEGVMMIGQAFADEIFRVFQNRFPEKRITWIKANRKVEAIIQKAIAERKK